MHNQKIIFAYSVHQSSVCKPNYTESKSRGRSQPVPPASSLQDTLVYSSRPHQFQQGKTVPQPGSEKFMSMLADKSLFSLKVTSSEAPGVAL